MRRLKPIQFDLKFGVIVTIIIIIVAVMETYSKWDDFKKSVFPNGIKLSWDLVLLLLALTGFITWFIMTLFWNREYTAHEITKKDRDNLKEELKISENARLTDVITGIPNSRSLEKDIEKYFSNAEHHRKFQFIFIDLKNFRELNKKFGFLKTNDLLRTIAQTIYKRMRRNEDMYKYLVNEEPRTYEQEGFYRIYPGGDEFVFIIEGDQSDALGFANRLVVQFEQLSKITPDIFGKPVKLSFYCSVVEMDSRDSFLDIFKKAEDCYKIAKQGIKDFTICWHPNNIERTLSKDKKKLGEYERTRNLFEVLTLEDKHYE